MTEKLTGDEEIEFSLQLHLPRDSQPITEDPEVISQLLKKTLATRPVVPRTVKTMLDDPIREFDRVMAEYEKAQPGLWNVPVTV